MTENCVWGLIVCFLMLLGALIYLIYQGYRIRKLEDLVLELRVKNGVMEEIVSKFDAGINQSLSAMEAFEAQAQERYLPRVEFIRDNTILDQKIWQTKRTVEKLEIHLDELLKPFIQGD